MDLIITTLLTMWSFWNYDYPFNLMAWIALLFGLVLQVLLLRRNRRLILFPLFWLVISLSCEYLYQVIRGFEAFGPAILGLLTYLALFGSILGIFIYKFWTRIHHS